MSTCELKRGRSRVRSNAALCSRSRISSKPLGQKPRKKLNKKRRRFSSISRHERNKSIKKEQRLLSTWNKLEIADWLQKHWNHKNDSSQLLAYIKKIKRDKKFDGKNVYKFDDRYLNILAHRCLGLKKGSTDYKLFIHSMRELQRTFCGKKNRKLHKSRYRTPPYSKKKGNKHLSKFPFSTNSYPESYLNAPQMLNISCTSPASLSSASDDETIYGVTAEELLNLISCGLCDSDYDSDYIYQNNVQQYIYQNTSQQTPSPTNVDIDELYTKYENMAHKNKNKTTVIPSILTVTDPHLNGDISLSPIAAKSGDMTLTFNMMSYSMTDESTDDEEIMSTNTLPPDINSALISLHDIF